LTFLPLIRNEVVATKRDAGDRWPSPPDSLGTGTLPHLMVSPQDIPRSIALDSKPITKLATYRLRSLLEEVANPARADQRDAVDGGTDTVFSHFEQQWSQFTWGRVAQGNFTPGLPQILA
jgi:hypothetical protein